MTYLQNSLNKFETYTYNIKLYMVDPTRVVTSDQSALRRLIDNGTAELVADNSQEARYNIARFESMVVPDSAKARNMILTSASMNITESNGITFVDRILKMAVTLGIKNHTQAVYIVAVKFLGRDHAGNPITGESFYYSVIISDLSFSIDDGGTNYDIQLKGMNTDGYSYINQVLKNQITVEASSVGEFVRRFERLLERNALEQIATEANRVYPDLITFEFRGQAKTWLSWRFEQLDDPLQLNGINVVGDGLSGEDKLQFTLTSGSNIVDVFSMMFSATKEYKEIQTDTPGSVYRADGASQPGTATLNDFPVFYKVIPEVKFNNYDPLRGAYQRTINYVITPYMIPSLAVDSISYNEGIANTGVQNNRVRKLIDYGLLRKRFDYLYTGLNTEILGLDLKIDNSFYQSVALGAGWTGDANVLAAKKGQDETSTVARLRNVTANIARFTSTQSQLQTQLERNRSQAERLESSIDAATGDFISEPLNSTGLTNQVTTLQELNKTAEQLESQIVDLDIQINTLTSQQRGIAIQYQEERELDKGVIVNPVRFEPDRIDSVDYFAPENDLEGGAISFGAVKSNIENVASLVNIEMHIKGDPYWLGTSDRSSSEFADYTAGQQMFYLKVYLPQADEDAAGRRPPKINDQISAVYVVKDVISQFNNGVFEQYLSAFLDLTTNAPTARDALERGETNTAFNTGTRQQLLSVDTAEVLEQARNRFS